jgi:hypothetical protein
MNHPPPTSFVPLVGLTRKCEDGSTGASASKGGRRVCRGGRWLRQRRKRGAGAAARAPWVRQPRATAQGRAGGPSKTLRWRSRHSLARAP